ncbi:MAG TPA: flagellar motor protein MotD [Ectothiorhodospiraceae bacterium]|nr:flagellar motor protein MotD [Ectothiorhodospiraceae bacterium]
MARKKRHQEEENMERWLISYADFITLLFAFFVVMYSISSVNEGKYRVLSDTLTNIFDNVPKSTDPLETDEDSGRVGKPTTIDEQKVSSDSLIDMPFSMEEKKKLEAIADMVEEVMKGWIDDELIKVTRNDKWLEIEIKSSLLYLSGSAEVEPEAFPVIDRIASILRNQPNYIQVEGFTDNIPIRSAMFPSNWELSASRAASVVHLFMEDGIAPDRMAAIGYGEYRPIADNATREGRAKNRRVVLIVLAEQNPEHVVDTQRESEINFGQSR